MKIKWLGHSCFKMLGSNGVRILTDPFDDNVGYKLPSVEAEIVTTSHSHYDHNFVDCVIGDFDIINTVGEFNIKGVSIIGVPTYHDNEMGGKRGNNIVYKFEIDGINICHMGDLGHVLTEAQLKAIGSVDIVFIPVGGNYTIDAEVAMEVIDMLKPKMIFPMHYKTPLIHFDIAGVENFIEKFEHVKKVNSQVLEINPAELPEAKTVVLLNYE